MFNYLIDNDISENTKNVSSQRSLELSITSFETGSFTRSFFVDSYIYDASAMSNFPSS
jgi:hypothetical protein